MPTAVLFNLPLAQPAFWRRERTIGDRMNLHFVPGQSRYPRENRDVRSDSWDEMISFRPTKSSFGHKRQRRSRSGPTGCRAWAESTRGQIVKNPERKRRSLESVHGPDRQKDRKTWPRSNRWEAAVRLSPWTTCAMWQPHLSIGRRPRSARPGAKR